MTRTIRALYIPALLFSVLFLEGCAFGTRQPLLTYPPAEESSVIPTAQAATTSTDKNLPVVLIPFTDQRTNKKVVGTVRNGWGMRTADVIPTNNVPEWLTQAIRTELEKNGYTVISGTSPDISASNRPVISGDIINVFCDMFFAYSGEVSITARVKQNGKEILHKHYVGEGSVGLAWAATENSYAQSLALALSDALKKFIQDLNHTNMDRTAEGPKKNAVEKDIKSSIVQKAAIETKASPVKKESTSNMKVSLSFWDGKWYGLRDGGSSGDCSSYIGQDLSARIFNGRVNIKKSPNYQTWGAGRESSAKTNIQGSINESSEIIVDQGDKFLNDHYMLIGSYNENKQRLQGVWAHDECEGKWWLRKR